MSLAMQQPVLMPLPLVPVHVTAQSVAERATSSLIAEALLTPKPALVDRRGPGAHRDMDLGVLLLSAASLQLSFRRMAECAHGATPNLALREELARIGREAEQVMLAATGGSNAHRGAIWILGLLVAGRMMCGGSAAATEVAVKPRRDSRMSSR